MNTIPDPPIEQPQRSYYVTAAVQCENRDCRFFHEFWATQDEDNAPETCAFCGEPISRAAVDVAIWDSVNL